MDKKTIYGIHTDATEEIEQKMFALRNALAVAQRKGLEDMLTKMWEVTETDVMRFIVTISYDKGESYIVRNPSFGTNIMELAADCMYAITSSNFRNFVLTKYTFEVVYGNIMYKYIRQTTDEETRNIDTDSRTEPY